MTVITMPLVTVSHDSLNERHEKMVSLVSVASPDMY